MAAVFADTGWFTKWGRWFTKSGWRISSFTARSCWFWHSSTKFATTRLLSSIDTAALCQVHGPNRHQSAPFLWALLLRDRRLAERWDVVNITDFFAEAGVLPARPAAGAAR